MAHKSGTLKWVIIRNVLPCNFRKYAVEAMWEPHLTSNGPLLLLAWAIDAGRYWSVDSFTRTFMEVPATNGPSRCFVPPFSRQITSLGCSAGTKAPTKLAKYRIFLNEHDRDTRKQERDWIAYAVVTPSTRLWEIVNKYKEENIYRGKR